MAATGNPRTLWMLAQLPVRRAFSKNWSATVRHEVYWDRNGGLTGFPQTVKANTTTLEYGVPHRQANVIVRLEHGIDDSGVGGLTPTRNLLILRVRLTFDSHFQAK